MMHDLSAQQPQMLQHATQLLYLDSHRPIPITPTTRRPTFPYNLPLSMSAPPSPALRWPANGAAASHLPRVSEPEPLLSHSEVVRQLRIYSTDKVAVQLAAALTTLALHPASLHPPLSSLPPTLSPSLPTLLSLLFTLQHCPPPLHLPSPLYHHSSSLFLLHLSFYLHHHALLTLLDLLRSLHPHLAYYQSIDTSPPPLLTTLNQHITAVVQLHFPSSTSPSPSSSSSPSSSPTPHLPSLSSPSYKLRRLLRMQKVWTTRAGRLALRAHKLRWFLSLPHSTLTLPIYVDRCTRYIRSLYRYISGHPAPPTPPTLPSSLTLLEDSILGLDELKEWFHQHLQPLRKPSHLQRHWLRYAGLTLTTLVASRMLYKHRASIMSRMEGTYASLSLFAHDHLIEPVTSIYESVFSTFQHRSTLGAVNEQLKESEAVLAGMLKDYGLKHHLPAHELVGMAQTGDMSLVMHDYREGIQRPLYSLAFRDLLQQFLIQVQQVKVSGEEAMVTMDQILSANAINFNILATIPAVLLGLGVVYGVRDGVVRLAMRGSDSSTVYEAVRRRMREVESIFIQYLYYGQQDQPRYRHTRALQQWREKEEMRERGEEDDDDEAQEERQEEQEEAAEEAEEHHEDLADANAHPTTPAIDIVSPQYLPSWAHGQVLLLLHSLPAVHNLLDRAERVGWGRSLELLCDPSLTPQQKVSCTLLH